MSFTEALEKVIKGFSNHLVKDNPLYDRVTEELFGEPCKWDLEMLVRIEASIASAEYTGTLPGNPVHSRFKSTGYKPKEFLISYFRCLLEVYTRNFHKKSLGLSQSSLKEELFIIYEMITYIEHRAKKTEKEHLSVLRKSLQKVVDGEKKFFCYHAGYPGHTLYINYFSENHKLYAAICNLGRGIEYHDKDSVNPQLYYPRVLKITNTEKHLEAIYKAKIPDPKSPLTKKKKRELLKLIYTSGKSIENRLAPEFLQNTPNCVIKNYLQSLLYRLNDDNEFKNILNAIRGTIASHIMEHDKVVFTKREVKQLNDSLAKSQTVYKDDNCEELLDGLPIYQVQRRVEQVEVPSGIDSSLATSLGGLISGLAGGYLAHQLVKDTNMSETSKYVVVAFSGALCGYLGGSAAHSLAQSKISPRRVEENSPIAARNLMSCNC